MLGFSVRQHVVEFIPGTGMVTDGAVNATSLNGPWTWVAPDGFLGPPICDVINGGGGGGGGGSIAGGAISAGGGGGGCASGNFGHRCLNVVPGDTLTVTIGAPGNGGAVGGAGGGGGNTSIALPQGVTQLGGSAGGAGNYLVFCFKTSGGGGAGGTSTSGAAPAGAGGGAGPNVTSPGAYNFYDFGFNGWVHICTGGSGGAGAASGGTAGSNAPSGIGTGSGSGSFTYVLWGSPTLNGGAGATTGTISEGGGGWGGILAPYMSTMSPGGAGGASPPTPATYGYGGGGGGGGAPGANGAVGYARITYWSVE